MTTVDPVFAAVTAPGTPFEIGERDDMRQFVNAPPDLNMLIEAARRHGDKTFIVEGERRFSFDDIFRLRDALVPKFEIQRGDHVAICMRNRSEWMVAFLAVVRAGGVAALVNSRGAPEELVAMIEGVEAKLVLADGGRAALLREGGFAGRIMEIDEFPTLDEAGEADTPAAAQESASPDDPCVILFTSGTTGRVKGAMLSHKNLITGLLSMQLSGLMVIHNMARAMNIEPETLIANIPQQAVLQVFPLFHISGLGAAFLSPLFAGSKIVILRRWDAEETMRLIGEEGITQLTGVPTMLWDLIRVAKGREAELVSLRSIGTGGQALPVNLLDAIRELCPHAVMGTGYGMTESAGSVAMAVGEDFVRNRAAAGRVLNLVDMKIVGPDGETLPIGEAGEIVVRGPMIMQGYWKQPEATAEVLGEDGWFKTGDVGYLDEEDYIFIVDRKKDMVISGGENIYCAEVERVMGEIPEVTECAAFGIPDERLGERLVAVVVAEGIDEAAIIENVGEHLARYKAPGRVAFFEEPLPRNAVGKVDKVQLRAAWPELMGETV
ncbi:MAG: class I adenylate-forming enzyme family protein [Pseudomonadota bacterium]